MFDFLMHNLRFCNKYTDPKYNIIHFYIIICMYKGRTATFNSSYIEYTVCKF